MMNLSPEPGPLGGDPSRPASGPFKGVAPKARGHSFNSRMIVNELSDLIPTLIVEGTVNLRTLHLLARSGGLELDLPESKIEGASIYEALAVIHKINERLLVPSGVIAIVNFVGERASLSHGLIDVSSIKPIPSPGGTVFSANVRWERMESNEPGNSYGALAIVDPEAARRDALSLYLILPNIVKTAPLASLLMKLLRREGADAALYTEWCGTERIRGKVVSSAQQSVFLSACGVNTKTSEGAFQGIRLLTKPGSSLRLYAAPVELTNPWQAQFAAHLVFTYAASLHGIISEIDAAIERDAPGLGHLKGVDYLLTEFGIAERELTSPNAASLEAASAKLLTSGLADMGYISLEQLKRVLDLRAPDGCKRLRQIFEHLRKTDFRSIEERIQIVGDERKRAEALQ